MHNKDESTATTIWPRHDTTVRLVEFPSQDPAEVQQMAALSVEEMTPFSRDEIALSTSILQTLPNGSSQVMIAIAHLDLINETIQDKHPKALYLSTQCLLLALEHSGRVSSDSLMAYAHSESGAMDIIILDHNTLVFNSGVVLHDSESSGEIIDAIDKALKSYARESDAPHSNFDVHVSSAYPLGEGFPDACGARIAGFVHDTFRDDTPLLRQGAQQLDAMPAARVIDLLPESLKNKRSQQAVKRSLTKQLALFALMILLIIGTFAQAIVQRQGYLVELETEASELRPIAQAVMQKRSHLQRLQERVTRTDTPYQHLGRIMAQTPQGGLTFSRFSYDHNDGITLSGRADSRERFDSLIDQLRIVGKTVYPQFAQAQSIYDRQRKENSSTVWEYAISIDFPERSSDSDEDGGGTDE